MRVAIPVWNGKISPVLDAARRLCIYDVSGDHPVLLEEIETLSLDADLAEFIASRADAIICGALSGQLEQQLLSRGVTIHPWVMGEADRLLECYAAGNIRDREFSMPGCRGKGCGRCGRRRRCSASRSGPE